MALEPKVTFPMVCAYAAASWAVIGPRYASQIWDWRDYSAFAVFFLLLWWCFKPSRSAGLVGADTHEDARKSLAFRLGKSLNGIRRGLRS